MEIFVPRQLSALQVAFEIDDNLYEVHRLTRTVDDARDILQQGRVAFGVGLYMMGMLGVLLLISELFSSQRFISSRTCWIIGLFVLLPILISPWETMNAQLAGKGGHENRCNVDWRRCSACSHTLHTTVCYFDCSVFMV